MIKGIIEENGKACCGKCKREIDQNDVKNELNYCFVCGNPLNETAVQLEYELTKNAKLETVKEIMNIVKNPSDLMSIAEYSKRI